MKAPVKFSIQLLLRGYKQLISPLLPASCRFTPTCSEYAQEAVERHGVLFGLGLSAWRILRCNPFFRGGLDPVPAQLFHHHSEHFCDQANIDRR